MSVVRNALLAAVAALAALSVAGCGKEEEAGPQIPRADASALINRLEEAQRRSDPFRCNDLRKDTVPALEQQLQALPDNLDADVRATLDDGIAHLSQLVDQECDSQQKEKPAETTPTTPSETPSTPTETTPAPTTPGPTTPAPTTPAPETPAPETPGGGGTPSPDGNNNGAAAPGNGKQTKPKGKPTA